MTPIKMTFRSGHTLTAWSNDPDSFAKSISDASPPEITNIEYDRSIDENRSDLKGARLTLKSGSCILCETTEDQINKAIWIEEITELMPSNEVAYGRLLKEEADLDTRLNAAYNVINHIPNMETRLYLHQNYLKRKAAYIAALEALIDGTIRRPTE